MLTEKDSKKIPEPADNPWRTITVDTSACRRYQIGPLKMWIEGAGREWMVAYSHCPEERFTLEIGIDEAKPEDLQWTQIITGAPSATLRFVPIMPDRPVVVRLRNPTRIEKDGNCVLFAFIPVWVQLNIGETTEGLLEMPTVKLSNTWFGDTTMAGEMCYSLKIPCELTLVTDVLGPYRVICPVRIHNTSDADLALERVCIHVEHLSIYRGRQGNWANEVAAEYRKEEQKCEIRYGSCAPEYDGIGDLLSEARDPVSRNLLLRTIGSLKTMSF